MNNTITNSSVVGNEQFKAWLKTLDPVSRVRKMSAIAKTQSSAGLRGSLIKASLAQLSRRCEVMLIRLTDDEVKYYTRRKPIKRPQVLEDHIKDKHLDVKPQKISKSSISHNPQNESEEAKCKFKNHTGQKKLPINVAKIKKTDNRLKEKYRKLFGDDLDDLPLATNNLDDSSQYKHSISADKPIKNYFNSVHVNIYNLPSDISAKKNDTIVDNTNCTEKNVFYVKDSANTNLKIDVSMPISKCRPDLSNLEVLPHQGEVQYHTPSKRKSRKPSNSSKRKNIHKSKASKPKRKPVSNINVNLGEDSTKMLWSILGMESPTDRSESIIRSHPLLSNSDINKEPGVLNSNAGHDKDNNPTFQPITLIQDSNGIVKLLDSTENVDEGTVIAQKHKRSIHQYNSSIEGSQAVKLSVPSENETVHNSLETPLNELETHEETIKESLPDLNKDSIESLANEDTVSLEGEPVCKIANTFSLARFPSLGSFNMLASPIDGNDTEINVQCDVNKNGDNKEEDDFRKPHVIDTVINLEVDNNYNNEKGFPTDVFDTSNNSKSGNTNNELSKVGTIRVKNIGVLMNPELSQHMNSPGNLDGNKISPNNSNKTPSDSVDTYDFTQSDKDELKEIEDRFILTYKHYFDNFVESRIPKLGELLHLAIADLIRKEERIKRAEQLSSDDLINDEKQRAEKDYNEMIKKRGIEFSPLYASIFKKFDEKSKQTLFLSLFCRLLKHAEQIDPANKNCVIKGRNVIRCMLSKHQCAEVLELLTSNFEVFQKQFGIVNDLVIKCTDSHKIPNNTVNNSAYINSSQNSLFSSLSTAGKPNQITAKPIGKSLPVKNIVLPTTMQGQETSSQKNFPVRISIKNPASLSTTNLPNFTTKEMPNQITTKPIGKSLPVRNIVLPTTMQGQETLSQTKFPVQISNKHPASFSITNLPNITAMEMPNQTTAKPVGISFRKIVLPTTNQGKETTSQTRSFIQTSNKNPGSYSIANLPNISVTTTHLEKSMPNRNPPEKDNIYLQSSTQKVSSGQLIMEGPSSTGISSKVLSQRPTNTSSSNLQTVNNINLSQEYCPTRAIPLRDNHVIEKDKFDAVYNKMNISSQLSRSVLIPAVKSSNSYKVGLNSTTSNYAKNNNEENLQGLQIASNLSNGDIYHTSVSSTGTSNNTGDVMSLSKDKNCEILRKLSNTQAPLPSSSHCHPFEKRMLISGKMKMMFENSNFTN